MTIEALIEAVPPPVTPQTTFDGPWEPIEAELGTPLPQDYKDFVRLYGYGNFLEIIGIHVPTSTSPYVRLVPQVPAICYALRGEEDRPYPLWPEPGGLIPFGKTDFGDFLCWLPHGEPKDWGVVVYDRGFGGFEAFDCSLTTFLAGLATGELLPKEFPTNLLPCDEPFAPQPA
ncbi:SMI1/KNR4 family protein [Phenylobacterium sp.]|jgi:hypothetical protein|uniref:SMI1/KNR4 family protein n=1 Tax=Phenylobacterium sp. TaxID=1871053 RepID=UPI0035B21CB1